MENFFEQLKSCRYRLFDRGSSASTSPYLRNDNRLADVIAAIQVLGTYKFYKLGFAEWADRISGDETTANHWRKVFEEHPEFFRLDSPRQKASLVWRRQHQKNYNVDKEEKITRNEFDALKETGADLRRISRTPLDSKEISALVTTAIDLHSRALERQRDSRWWVPLGGAFIGVLVGGLVRLAY